MNGKGSTQRLRKISAEEWEENYRRIYGRPIDIADRIEVVNNERQLLTNNAITSDNSK